MDSYFWVALAVVVAALGVVALVLSRRASHAEHRLADMAAGLGETRTSLEARLGQMAEVQASAQARIAERLHAQERVLAETLGQRLAEISSKLGESLHKSTTQTLETMGKIEARLAVIDQAQKNITELSSQVVALQDVLANKQARGAFGEIQLTDLVKDTLPPSAYEFQATLANNRRVDCLLKLPTPPGPIPVDAKFPLESYRALREAKDDRGRIEAARAFKAAVLKHVSDIAERYIVPGETAESALMFLPSEAVYAELHAHHQDVVDASHRRHVWIVSPTTLMATLITVRAVLKDARTHEQAGLIQREVRILLDDVQRLDKRVANLQRHFDQAVGDVREIRISTQKVSSRAERIEAVEIEDGSASTPALGPAGPGKPEA